MPSSQYSQLVVVPGPGFAGAHSSALRGLNLNDVATRRTRIGLVNTSASEATITGDPTGEEQVRMTQVRNILNPKGSPPPRRPSLILIIATHRRPHRLPHGAVDDVQAILRLRVEGRTIRGCRVARIPTRTRIRVGESDGGKGERGSLCRSKRAHRARRAG